MGGKVNRIRGDLDDVETLLEVVHILKDVSTNRFFSFVQKKMDFTKFLEVFMYFFDQLEHIQTNSPLVRNALPARDIVVITSDAGFMSSFNGRVLMAAKKEEEKLRGMGEVNLIVVGTRVEEKCKQLGLKVAKMWDNESMEEEERLTLALRIRDYLVERVLSGESGGCRIIYIWPKSFNVLKPRVVKLLPTVELMDPGLLQEESDEGKKKKRKKKTDGLIQESHIDGMMKVLSDLWISARLFEILTETLLAEAAAQAQQLETAIEGLSSEKKALMVSFKKAGRDELNKAMREVFSASSVIKGR